MSKHAKEIISNHIDIGIWDCVQICCVIQFPIVQNLLLKEIHGQQIEVFLRAIYKTPLFFLPSSKLLKTVK